MSDVAFIVGGSKIVERKLLKVCPCCGGELLHVARESATNGENWLLYFYACKGSNAMNSQEVGRLMVFPAPRAGGRVAVNMPENYDPPDWGIARWDIHCPVVKWEFPRVGFLRLPPDCDDWIGSIEQE